MSSALVDFIARVCHEANRALCEAAGDHSQKPWDEADDWQRDSARRGVEYAIEHPDASPEDQHAAWMADKLKAGWVYGVEKDAGLKTHPSLLAYADLPPNDRAKDHVFRAIVSTLMVQPAPQPEVASKPKAAYLGRSVIVNQPGRPDNGPMGKKYAAIIVAMHSADIVTATVFPATGPAFTVQNLDRESNIDRGQKPIVAAWE